MLAVGKEPELLATFRASFLEKLRGVAMPSAGEFYWRNTPFVVFDLPHEHEATLGILLASQF